MRAAPGFTCTMYVITAFVVPESGEIPVIHDTSLEAVQVPEHDAATVSVVLNVLPATRTNWVAGLSAYVHGVS